MEPITQDDVATAVTFACLVTGEDPIEVASGQWRRDAYVGGDSKEHVSLSHHKARHYAFHALALEFEPQSLKEMAAVAVLVGAISKPNAFVSGTRWGVLTRGDYQQKPGKDWFDFRKLHNVRLAVRTRRGLEPVADLLWPNCEPFDWATAKAATEAQVASSPVLGGAKSQGLCETTMTERFAFAGCRCKTYEGNLGPCKTFLEGAYHRCVYCDHGLECHKVIEQACVVDISRAPVLTTLLGLTPGKVADKLARPKPAPSPVKAVVGREIAVITRPKQPRKAKDKLADGWAGKITLRHAKAIRPDTDVTTQFIPGDPPFARSALATAKPWVPYEQRAEDNSRYEPRRYRGVTSSTEETFE